MSCLLAENQLQETRVCTEKGRIQTFDLVQELFFYFYFLFFFKSCFLRFLHVSEDSSQQHTLFTSCLLFGQLLERGQTLSGGAPSVLTNPLHNMETSFSWAIHNSQCIKMSRLSSHGIMCCRSILQRRSSFTPFTIFSFFLIVLPLEERAGRGGPAFRR